MSKNRKCNTCGLTKPITSFYKRGDGRVRASCKSCYDDSRTIYKLANSDVIKARQKDNYTRTGHIKRAKRITKYASDGKLRDTVLKQSKKYYETNKEAALDRMTRYRRKLKLEIIAAYGGKCTCPGCGIDEPDFLTVEHLNKDGKVHRASGVQVYADIRRRGFPSDYTVYCFNCNIAKSLFGICPHQRLKCD